MKIAIDKIIPNPEQPRTIDKVELEELAFSIKNVGLLNPIAVEGPCSNDTFILIDGERRWRACQLAGYEVIEANVVRAAMNGDGQLERLLLALTANLQRQDMNPIEEGRAFLKLQELGLTMDQIAGRTGKKVSYIGLRMSLINFPKTIQKHFAEKKLPLGWDIQRALSSLEPDLQERVAGYGAENGLSINQVISMCERVKMSQGSGEKAKGVNVSAAERRLRTGETWTPFHITGDIINEKALIGWEMIKEKATKVCKKCVLYEVANKKNCIECPAVVLIGLLMEGAK